MRPGLNHKKFFAKLLLFGEYTVVKGSNALAAPFSMFSGSWKFSEADKENLQCEIPSFLSFLSENRYAEYLNLEDFQEELEKGLYFDSNIPVGYGAGSSGALCAAIFDRYGKEKIKHLELSELRTVLGKMESFFHGKSSGLDPLVAYLNRPLFIQAKELKPIDSQGFAKGLGKYYSLFLLDTQTPRQTEPLVKIFMDQCQDKSFNDRCSNELVGYNNACIESLLNGKASSLFEAFSQVSAFQFEFFRPMIPEAFQDVWRMGLKSKDLKLKLCGAGGGGFFLGITKDFGFVRKMLPEFVLFEINPEDLG